MESKQNNRTKSLGQIEKFQYEIADGNNKIPIGYAGAVGGNMVKRMIEKAEQDMIKKKSK